MTTTITKQREKNDPCESLDEYLGHPMVKITMSEYEALEPILGIIRNLRHSITPDDIGALKDMSCSIILEESKVYRHESMLRELKYKYGLRFDSIKNSVNGMVSELNRILKTYSIEKIKDTQDTIDIEKNILVTVEQYRVLMNPGQVIGQEIKVICQKLKECGIDMSFDAISCPAAG